MATIKNKHTKKPKKKSFKSPIKVVPDDKMLKILLSIYNSNQKYKIYYKDITKSLGKLIEVLNTDSIQNSGIKKVGKSIVIYFKLLKSFLIACIFQIT